MSKQTDSPFSFKGINPLSDPLFKRELWVDRLVKMKPFIDEISLITPREVVALYETYNDLLAVISDDKELVSYGQIGSIVKPKSAPKWLRYEIEQLEKEVRKSFRLASDKHL